MNWLPNIKYRQGVPLNYKDFIYLCINRLMAISIYLKTKQKEKIKYYFRDRMLNTLFFIILLVGLTILLYFLLINYLRI